MRTTFTLESPPVGFGRKAFYAKRRALKLEHQTYPLFYKFFDLVAA
jgi:hypothetical protein